MDTPPDDPAARREWLERWVAERAQEGRIEPPVPPLPVRTRLWHRVRHPLLRARFWLARKTERLADRRFDRDLATIESEALPEHDHPDRVAYHPSPWWVLPRALRHLDVSGRDVFVDFGCGKGRVVHQAAKRPFRRVIGVEISPKLADQARRFLASQRHRHRCHDVEIVVADVKDYRLPDDFTVGFLFHPFQDETFDALVRAIIESIDRNPRRIRLIYFHPFQGERLLATGRFRLLKVLRSRFFDTRPFRTAIYENSAA